MVTIVDGDLFVNDCEAIIHQVNTKGVWGNTGGKDNVALQMRKYSMNAYQKYKKLCSSFDHNRNLLMGMCQMIKTKDKKWIGNLFAQLDYGSDGSRYTEYKAFKHSLQELHISVMSNEIKSIAMPYKIGCCRGGGDWDVVYRMIVNEFGDSPISVIIYNKKQ